MSATMTHEEFTKELEAFVLSCPVAPDIAAHALAMTGQRLIDAYDAGQSTKPKAESPAPDAGTDDNSAAQSESNAA